MRNKPSRVVLFPWKMGSKSGKLLANALGIRRVYHDGKYVPRHGDVIINWGNSKKSTWWSAVGPRGATVLNHPDAVARATNKIHAFEAMQDSEVSLPEWTTDAELAHQWYENDDVVCARVRIAGHSAEGMFIFNRDAGDEFIAAPLYTKYVKKAKEYRIHVFNGVVIDAAEKRLRRGIDPDAADYRIRNYTGGWVYAREDLEVPPMALEQAILAIRAVGLDFGAVDIGWNEHYQSAIVYEVNSAPGLTGTTLYRYAACLDALYDRCSLGIPEPPNNFDMGVDFDPDEFLDANAEEDDAFDEPDNRPGNTLDRILEGLRRDENRPQPMHRLRIDDNF